MALWAAAVAADAPQKRAPKRQPPAAGQNAPAKPTPSGTASTPAIGAEDYRAFAIYEKTAPRPQPIAPRATQLPLVFEPGDRIALVGNTLFERSQEFGHLEAMLQRQFPEQRLVVRHLAWSADEIDLAPRPDNFADTQQHLLHERANVVLAAFGFNESFAGQAGLADFRRRLTAYVQRMKALSFDGRTAPRLVLVSPIANENVPGVAAADRNNARIRLYADVLRDVAREQQVGYVDVFTATEQALRSPGSDLTTNGIHLEREGDKIFSAALFRGLVGAEPPEVDDALLSAVVDKNRQFFRRFRPLNTFYYTGGRNKDYGYLDFLPAMRNFDLLVANRDQRIWDLAQGRAVPVQIDDSNVPPLPEVPQGRGANEWLSAAQEREAFRVDPRFRVELFAGEEQFPEMANPIQMRWDARGRLWVSRSLTYPHVYPGQEPRDQLVILEDTNDDGRADKSTVFADHLHIPLSFELGDGGVYVSEQPQLTFLKDTNGDDRADVRQVVLSGFGTEDSHHALHDFTWTPDGDLLLRESIFHHSQIETPYGPVRQQNSGWFRYDPRTRRLISFGTYHSTNPWGVTFDDWGQHLASHPVYAAAFHSLDPPYPQQHLPPQGLQAYSGVCGHEFVDFATFPPELKGSFIKVRYKPTNRVEIHRWEEGPFGFCEQYQGDLLFSTNLSFIPTDIGFGPDGALYVCDWYNPIKGHAQYSLRDQRRDRHSGRIWRITALDQPAAKLPPRLDQLPVPALVELLRRPEYRLRYWAKRELRSRRPAEVLGALENFVARLDRSDPRLRHHQLEALWTCRVLGLAPLMPTEPADSAARQQARLPLELLRQLLVCEEPHARAAATQQLRYWHAYLDDAPALLQRSANDPQALVRMEAAIAASYVGTEEAFQALRETLNHPRQGAVAYAIHAALASHTMRPYWEDRPQYGIARVLQQASRNSVPREPRPTAAQAQFDREPELLTVQISCVSERMLFSLKHFSPRPGQPVKLVLTNLDATDHNLVLVQPDALAEVGIAANEMARDPRNANSDFLPPDKRHLVLEATPLIGPTRAAQIAVLRFHAPQERGVYPYVCTFPGHWVVMNGQMIVARDAADAEALLVASQPKIVREWALADFADWDGRPRGKDEATLARGMSAFVKARCNQCHVVAGHGVNLGPDLAESIKKLQGRELLEQMLAPSSKIHPQFQNYQLVTSDGRVVTGVIVREEPDAYQVATNLLTPHTLTTVRKRDVEEKIASQVSPMPVGLLNVLTRDEILDLHAFVSAGDYKLPAHLEHQHQPNPHGKATPAAAPEPGKENTGRSAAGHAATPGANQSHAGAAHKIAP